MHETLGFGHFITHADSVAAVILALMLLASIGTWYLILIQALRAVRRHKRSATFRQRFCSAESIEAVVRDMCDGNEPFSRVLHEGLVAVSALRGGRRGTTQGLIESMSSEDFLTRALKQAIDRERAELNYGQSFLATVASTAPFVGLFGTVCGIYHALMAIGLSGQGTLDKVAGPVGEALIMTAIGLAVAIPASLAYNNVVRHNRNLLNDLGAFAHDVFCMLSTGSKTSARAADPAHTSQHLLSLMRAAS